MLPGIGGKMKDIESMIDESALERTKAIILSMTPQERSNPGNPERFQEEPHCQRSRGGYRGSQPSGKQFEQSKKMMKQMPGMMGGKSGKRGGFKLPF